MSKAIKYKKVESKPIEINLGFQPEVNVNDDTISNLLRYFIFEYRKKHLGNYPAYVTINYNDWKRLMFQERYPYNPDEYKFQSCKLLRSLDVPEGKFIFSEETL